MAPLGHHTLVLRSLITYFEPHLWTADSENQHVSDKFRSSRPELFCKKVVLRNFAKFKGEHPCHSLFFKKVAGLRLVVQVVEVLVQVFSCEYCEISKNALIHRKPPVAASANLPKDGNFWFVFIFFNLLILLWRNNFVM